MGLLEILVFIYSANAALLLTHEIDAAYWKEWNLFSKRKIKDEQKAMNNFLIFHIIAIPLFLYGLIEIYTKTLIGMSISLLLGLCGIFAFIFHMIMVKKGRKEFTAPMSIFILIAIFAVSIIQTAISILYLI